MSKRKVKAPETAKSNRKIESAPVRRARWSRYNFRAKRHPDGTTSFSYCDGEHEKCSPCNEHQVMLSDIEYLARCQSALKAIRSQLGNIQFNLNQKDSPLPDRAAWLRMLGDMLNIAEVVE